GRGIQRDVLDAAGHRVLDCLQSGGATLVIDSAGAERTARVCEHSATLVYAMKIPGGDAAIVDRQKLTGYCLNPEHPRQAQSGVFATLGFTAENADALRAALLTAAATGDAQPAGSDQ